ncbi:23S rRNA (uracil(1939)-C(5))-methyltransferase RlmD [Shewanella algae]|uniref:23S rRNA (uracil(1939)-C(5))-methyltransferase RlmD n=1 Tax=Shewanella algae TaxID=38313 RepID=UPI0031F58D3F
MAQFFREKPNRSKKVSAKLSLTASGLDHQGAGIGQYQGKVVFIPGLLPGESAEVQLTEQKKNYARGKLIRITQTSPERVEPQCPHYALCGGCDLQHLSDLSQRQHKRRALAELFAKLSGLSELPEIGELASAPWHYRRKARLATWYDKQSREFTLGFRAKSSSKVVAIGECPVLAASLSELIKPLAAQLAHLQGVAQLGHVELIETEAGRFVVLRITRPLVNKDKEKLKAFAGQQGLQLVLQDNQGECEYLTGNQPSYRLSGAEGDELMLKFNPGNFIQVNGEVNRAMVAKAIDWLQPKAGEHILDLFCGMGNFSLPLAASGARVTGVEGVPAMVEQARQNAKQAGLEGLQFFCADLSADLSTEPWLGKVDKLLLDPARAGAYETLSYLKNIAPERVVYVSCNPASLARDSVLLLEQGYRLERLCVLDMFPQTHHTEAMALFVRN